MAKRFRSEVNKFYGIRECEAGDVRPRVGESPRMKNFRVLSDHTLALREGFERVVKTSGEARGLFIGRVGSVTAVIWIVGSEVMLLEGSEARVIGTLESESKRVCILPLREKLYFLDGVKIKVWDTESFSDIVPYVPDLLYEQFALVLAELVHRHGLPLRLEKAFF